MGAETRDESGGWKRVVDLGKSMLPLGLVFTVAAVAFGAGAITTDGSNASSANAAVIAEMKVVDQDHADRIRRLETESAVNGERWRRVEEWMHGVDERWRRVEEWMHGVDERTEQILREVRQ